MKKIMLVIGCLFIAAMLMSCATYAIPNMATGNTLGSKVGTASANFVFGIFGDASNVNIPAAAKAGGITKISTVDVQLTNTLFLIWTVTCVVTGE
ncbi:MAG: hypothetical protein JW976_09680 [Syntrophaceae bacterium]|nr:hypothetical protein [Syntrophaceae bacterium]